MNDMEFIQFILYAGSIICLCIGHLIYDIVNLLFY